MAIDAREVSERVLAARLRWGWSRSRLAREAGIPAASLAHIEGGDRLPSMPEALQLAGALGATLGALTGTSAVRDRLTYGEPPGGAPAGLQERLTCYLELDAAHCAPGQPGSTTA